MEVPPKDTHTNKMFAAFNTRFTAGFSPLSLSPALWLSDTGASAGTWTDLSGNGREATSATPPSIISNALNGHQVRRFNGTSQNLLTSSLSTFSAYDIFAVASIQNWTGNAANSCFLSHGYSSSASAGVCVFVMSNTASLDWLGSDFVAFGSGYASTSYPRAIGPSASGSSARVINVSLGASLARVRQNGATISSRKEVTGSIASASGSIKIGGTSADGWWKGDVGEILILPYIATASQRASVELYLSRKWGITIA